MRFDTLSRWKSVLAIAVALLCGSHVAAQTQGIQRITQKIDEKNLVALKGNTHPLARAEFDQGLAPDSLPMNRLMLLLKRSPEQEASLEQLIDQQQEKSSANYHKWLTPAQFGSQFGASDADIQTVTAWLETHGFTVNHVSTSKMIVEFNGTAGSVRQAFHTEIHRYVVKGEEHWANNADPQIPAALTPVVAGIHSLHNFFKKPLVHKLGVVQRAADSHQVTPLFSYANPNGGGTLNALGPCDFAAIYNVLPLWNTTLSNCGTSAMPAGSTDGSGQTIAVVSETDINPLDVTNFRQAFGLPTSGYTQPSNCSQFFDDVCLILDGPDPGITNDETEADLDVQWSGAVAKGAVIDFVVSESTETDQGIDLSAEYIIDNNIAPVMSESYGACEADIGASGNAFYEFLWEQAAAQGMTVIISAGDEGSAGCDDPDLPSPNYATGGLAVNGLASTPFNVAVGGTDFDSSSANYQSTYWSASASNQSTSSNPISAKGYIPETTWNDTCAQAGVAGGCASPPNQDYISVVGGSGGQSNCETTNNLGNCVGYAKPSWQTGTGVPNDSARDLPDISLFAADGFISGSFYIICQQDADPNGNSAHCNLSAPFTDFVGVGGTSAGAPAFAGMMALVNQEMGNQHLSTAQGNANYLLYEMAATQTGNCNSSTGSASTCVFNDITKGNNSVACETGSPNCGASGSLAGILVSGTSPGFTTTAAYDLASGLGTINAYNLVMGWPSAKFTGTTTTLTMSPLTLSHGASVSATVTVTPDPVVASSTKPEDVTLLAVVPNGTIGPLFPGGNNSNYTFNLNSNGSLTGTTTYLPGGTYAITARYAGDGLYGASTSAPVTVTVNPENSSTIVSTLNVDLTSGNTNAATIEPYGSFDLIRVDVVGSASDKLGQTSCENTDESCATGSVTLLDNGQPLDPGMFPAGKLTLNAEGYAEVQTTLQVGPGAIFIPALPVGQHSFQATYAGDPSYNASTSAAVPFTITQAATSTAITSSPSTVQAKATFNITATVTTAGFGAAPTGIVTFMAGGQALTGTVTYTSVAPTVTTFSALQAILTGTSIATNGTVTITAAYGGDANYLVSTSNGVGITVTGGTATFSVSANPTTVIIVTPGQSGSSTATVAGNGFTGTVNLSCSVSPTSLTDPPACSMNPASVTLSTTTTSANSTLSVSTTAASALYKPMDGPASPGTYLPIKIAAAIMACAMLLALAVPTKKRRLGMVLGIAVFAVALCGEGCGGGGGGGFNSTNPGTTAGQYTVTITATSGNSTAATSVSLTVQ